MRTLKKPKVSERWHICFIGLLGVGLGGYMIKTDEILERGIVLGGIFIILGLCAIVLSLFFWDHSLEK